MLQNPPPPAPRRINMKKTPITHDSILITIIQIKV